MEKLSEMPNIGKDLEERLIGVGILSPSLLKERGSVEAFQLIHETDHGACINLLYVLEGAIQNIHWHKLDETKKRELQFYFKGIRRSGETNLG